MLKAVVGDSHDFNHASTRNWITAELPPTARKRSTRSWVSRSGKAKRRIPFIGESAATYRNLQFHLRRGNCARLPRPAEGSHRDAPADPEPCFTRPPARRTARRVDRVRRADGVR